ncbi:unnamed protein product [Arabidopsis lyrata]|uniref:F-box domain-containing protein n=1 Tax=Arabidopsis lyrata subsp. lyrata TaxID=81972 RepID=D7KAS9_ARALL|nr:putative F-box protein At1g47390 [Arabidopsis lyrata subsp. lyrata]EFH67613.1 hypothetical protein ARALYDRAFT_891523 [Arabidopsis lyrata subsp. lyrata]CAH8254781.1 unnamed protein product [Arabidopsis lyrata]|eukprot:XP_002891354.1 putative F-box protein At1g47390 [Arabidopsis lyrata subsp. lyrata]
MAQEKLPSELEEEILFRVPPLPLTRLRTVCKRWNTLFNEKRFIRNHLARAYPQFILATKSKFCSVSVSLDDDPKIEVRELNLDIPGLESQRPKSIHHHDGLLHCSWEDNRVYVWNPLLRESRWIEPYSKQSMGIEGIAYDDKGLEHSSLKFFESQFIPKFKWSTFYNFAFNAWKEYDFKTADDRFMRVINLFGLSVFLNGTLYWVASSSEYLDKIFIISLDCSTKRSAVFCCLPCKRTSFADAPILAVFREDRFSLLEQCGETRKIEIKVTKNKINNGDGESVDWIIFMTVSISNVPDLVGVRSYYPPSYFIDDKTLVMCSCDEHGQAWIYVMRGNKLSKTRIEVDRWPLQITYIPSLVPVPQGQREEVGLQV